MLSKREEEGRRMGVTEGNRKEERRGESERRDAPKKSIEEKRKRRRTQIVASTKTSNSDLCSRARDRVGNSSVVSKRTNRNVQKLGKSGFSTWTTQPLPNENTVLHAWAPQHTDRGREGARDDCQRSNLWRGEGGAAG